MWNQSDVQVIITPADVQVITTQARHLQTTAPRMLHALFVLAGAGGFYVLCLKVGAFPSFMLRSWTRACWFGWRIMAYVHLVRQGFGRIWVPNISSFALRHFVDDCRRRHKPLYACFVDLRKAYDCVPRPLLWQVMQNIGVPCQFLRAVQSMYDGVSCMVNIGGCLSDPFAACKGVKQGCPLSPTLFGIFIDRFHFNQSINQSINQFNL